jgi:hypothetical protein
MVSRTTGNGRSRSEQARSAAERRWSSERGSARIDQPERSTDQSSVGCASRM